MLTYTKVYGKNLWDGQIGRVMHGSAEVQALVLYLLTNRHSRPIGIYRLPLGYITADTGLAEETIVKAMNVVEDAGFAVYDSDTLEIFVVKSAHHFLGGDTLKARDKRGKRFLKDLEDVQSTDLLQQFLARYSGFEGLEEYLAGKGIFVKGASEGASEGALQGVENDDQKKGLPKGYQKGLPKGHKGHVEGLPEELNKGLSKGHVEGLEEREIESFSPVSESFSSLQGASKGHTEGLPKGLPMHSRCIDSRCEEEEEEAHASEPPSAAPSALEIFEAMAQANADEQPRFGVPEGEVMREVSTPAVLELIEEALEAGYDERGLVAAARGLIRDDFTRDGGYGFIWMLDPSRREAQVPQLAKKGLATLVRSSAQAVGNAEEQRAAGLEAALRRRAQA